MEELGIWEKLCHTVGKLSPPHHGSSRYGSSTTTSILRAGSRRKGSLILIGFGFVLGTSVLILTIILAMFPSVMNPMLQSSSSLAKVDDKPIPFSHSSSNSSSINSAISTFSSNPPQEILENSSTTTSNKTIISSPVSSNITTHELLENSTAIVSSSSPELSRDFIPANQTDSSSTLANYLSDVVSGSKVPKVAELVVANDETKAITATSTVIHDEKQQGNDNSSHGRHDCNIFEGEWVRPADDDIRKPFYPPGSCPYMERKPFDCYNNGRPDDAFLKLQWHWQSHPANAGCNTNFPSLLNASDFLERLRGKKVVFAGDSLNRNMFESFMCILWNALPDKSRVHWLPGSVDYKIRGDRSLKYEDYNCTVGFVWSPYLVYETNPPNRRNKLNMNDPQRMRLDMIDERASSFYRDADLIIFDSWHWWIKGKTNDGINYFQEGDYVHPKLEMSKAYKKGLTTWRKWMDKNIDPNKTQVVFRGYSVNHFRGGKWNTGGKCNRETEPTMSNETFVEKSPAQVKLLEDTLRKMKTPVIYLNVTKLTYYRTDGHPSIYANYMETYEARIAAALTHQDCSHWCLPGIPDTWNELLYLSLMRVGQGSFAP